MIIYKICMLFIYSVHLRWNPTQLVVIVDVIIIIINTIIFIIITIIIIIRILLPMLHWTHQSRLFILFFVFHISRILLSMLHWTHQSCLFYFFFRFPSFYFTLYDEYHPNEQGDTTRDWDDFTGSEKKKNALLEW